MTKFIAADCSFPTDGRNSLYVLSTQYLQAEISKCNVYASLFPWDINVLHFAWFLAAKQALYSVISLRISGFRSGTEL